MIEEGENRRAQILEHIVQARNLVLETKGDSQLIEQIDVLKSRIENASVLETYLKDFGKKELAELRQIIKRNVSEFAIRRKQTQLRYKRVFLVVSIPLALTIFSYYSITINHSNIDLKSPFSLVAWISLGVLLTTLFYITHAFLIFYINNHFIIKISSRFDEPLLFTAAGGITAFWYLIIHFYSFYIYSVLSPIVIKVAQGVVKLDFGSLFTTVSVILADIAALVATYDFIQKKLRKQSKDILSNEDQ